MNKKISIDNLYRQRFQGVKTTPRKDLWENISTRLPEKGKDRKVIPLWYKLSGVAASLATIVFFIFNPSEKTVNRISDSSFEEVVIPENQNNIFLSFQQEMQKSTALLEKLNTQTKSLMWKEIEYYKKHSQNADLAVVRDKPIINKTSVPAEISIPEEGTSAVILADVALEEEVNLQKKTSTKVDLPLESSAEAITEETKESLKKFRVSTKAAAVYYDYLGNSSSIDNRLAENKSSGEVSLAYGIHLSYQLNDKIKIRTGINKLDFNHRVQDVSFSTVTSAASFDNNPVASISIASPIKGELTQQIGFVEFPMEIQYGILNKKIGISIIAGGSTLLLQENNVALNSPGISNDFGRANNINEISFSSNLGLGIDYNVSPQFQINLEPVFKYQLNTFNNTPDLNPYNFGIYSGLSYKF